MRKAWSRPPAGQPEPSHENPPRDHSTRERWRSPHDTNAGSPMSVSGAMEGGSGSGEGCGCKQDSVCVNGDGQDGADGQETEFDTETETDGLDGKCILCRTAFWSFFTLFSIDTRQMPPPPMPASLDPTTVSSLAHAHAVRSASPRGSFQWDKNGVSATWTPPQTPTLMSASSGRSNQPPSQATSTTTLANHGTLSPSTSFPLAMQAQLQSHPPPLVPSVSPSAPFSKLSLHSPETSSSPHQSVPCSPNESTPLSSTSTSTERASDHPPSSPHRPSKPLHVHPQNESPLSASLPPPAVTLNSPDGTRDTPAEGQYQRPYRSSPEPRDEPHPPGDVEKKRPTNGEVYRVRFASPEILCGSTTSDSSESLDAYDDIPVNLNAIAVVKEHEVPSLDRDAMDVEIDVVGDDQGGDGSGPSHATSPESSMNDGSEDEHSPLPAPGSPRPQAPSDSQPHSILSVEDGATSEINSPPPASDVNETTSPVESMTVDPGHTHPALEPSPPPPPKVKMSLKDFALRKKKQREEEMAAKAFHSPTTPDGPALPPSPSVDVKRDLASELVGIVQAMYSGEMVNGQDVKMTDATKEDTLDSSGTAHVTTNGFDGGSDRGHDAVRGSGLAEENAMAEDNKPSAETQASSMIVGTKTPDTPRSSPQPARSSTISSRVLGERNYTDQTQMQLDGEPPTTLTAKMEMMDAMVPSGLVGADDSTPDVVSFAPEPPPPPLTTKQASDTTINHTVPVGSISRSVPPSTASISTPASMSTSTSTSAVNSRSNSVGIPVFIPNPNILPHAHVSSSSSSIPSSRRPSHEDGEITSSTPPKTYLPRSHTPPTQPRSFQAVYPSSPSIGAASTSTAPVPRRPAPPLSRSPLSNNAGPTPAPIASRPLPSGPRALRGSMAQPTHPYASTRSPYAASQYIPRGPSADRDRIDWERGDRQWTAQARSRGRAGSNGWGR
jgi:hypothetical protein